MKRDLIAVIWSLLVTGAISKWAFHVAYLERGYKAVGGEYLVILVAYVAAWKAINYLFDSLSGEEKLLAAVNKWLIGHEEGGLPEGSFIGLKGENIEV